MIKTVCDQCGNDTRSTTEIEVHVGRGTVERHFCTITCLCAFIRKAYPGEFA